MRASVVNGFNALDIIHRKANNTHVDDYFTGATVSSGGIRTVTKSVRSRSTSRQRSQSPANSVTTPAKSASPRTSLANVSEEGCPKSTVVSNLAAIVVTTLPSPVVKSRKRISTFQMPETIPQSQLWSSNEDNEAISANYNDYGELVGLETMFARPLVADEYTITEVLRKLELESHFEFRAMMREIILPQVNSKSALRTYY